MSNRNETGWWLQEPPDDEEVRYLPGHTDEPRFVDAVDWGHDWIYDANQYSEDARRSRELSLQNVDVVFDAKTPLPLFENVVVHDDGSFKVPERFIGHEKYGIWGFSAVGRLEHFKSRDEYGRIRSFQREDNRIDPIWVPHLYPFEEIDSKGLPLIRDRERCEMTVLLSRIDAPEIYPLFTEIYIGGQTYGASHDIEYDLYDGAAFTQFIAVDEHFTPESVEYSEERWDNLEEYLEEQGRLGDYMDIMDGNIPFPEEYKRQHQPLDWRSRQPSDVTMSRTGNIMVPIDDLRRGLDAQILFPMFREETLRTSRGKEI